MSLFKQVTEDIIKQIEKGVPPWHRPWTAQGLPYNLLTGKDYRGINAVILFSKGYQANFKSSAWMTFRQARANKTPVKRGEKGTKIVFFKPCFKEDPEIPEKEIRVGGFFKKYVVFNGDQLEGFEHVGSEIRNPETRLTDIDAAISLTGARIREFGGRACYIPSKDEILIPPFKNFDDNNTYYSTILHELAHWTGHNSRLNRPEKGYAFEELIAELASAFLTCHLGISLSPRLDHASYIANWLDALRKSPKYLLKAASAAQQASDYLLELMKLSKEKERAA